MGVALGPEAAASLPPAPAGGCLGPETSQDHCTPAERGPVPHEAVGWAQPWGKSNAEKEGGKPIPEHQRGSLWPGVLREMRPEWRHETLLSPQYPPPHLVGMGTSLTGGP